MLQLLLVDDEPMILQSMVANDWSSIGVENVYQAASGLEAAELLEKTPIDIVVTDIRMPGMNGLQLCKHIHEKYPRTKCILLSGYGEFEYAQQAIKYGTVNYLLKPIKDEELMGEVSRVRSLIQKEWEQVGSIEKARQTLHEHLPLLRSNMLHELLSGVSLSRLELGERLEEYEFPFVIGKNCALMLLRLEEGFGGSSEASTLYEFAVHNIACEILEADYNVWTCKDSFGYMCILLQEKEGEADRGGGQDADRHADTEDDREREEIGMSERVALDTKPNDSFHKTLDKAVHELQLKITALLKGGLSALISGRGPFPDQLAELYRKSLNEFRKVPRSDRGVIIRSMEPRAQSKSLDALYSPPGFQQLLEAGRWTDARAKIEAVFEEMGEKKLDSEEHMNEVVYTLMNAFYYIAHMQGKTLLELSGWEAHMAADPRVFTLPEQVMEWADRALQSMEAGSIRESRDGKNQLISTIHRYIEERIADDVSLQTIADFVGLHPVYLSSLYKQETKENISDFIMRYRMEKAGLLLRTTDIKIYELSTQLGFQNPPYFSKLFKRYYQMTPQMYRERHLG
ncbi:response regulator [Paenibacillus sp. HB172176]|uniref:response regulator transcription factor n=1 Tax=Paenibacillus sp. HB172176 TaxID=2493690 RepID=UPI00143C1FF3|nr:response regulator [Paenibacillus sp. HB172176]